MQRRTFLKYVVAAAGPAALETHNSLKAMNPGIQWGMYNRPWGNEDWPVQLDAMQAAGFTRIGLMGEPVRLTNVQQDVDRWKRLLQDRNMKLVSTWFATDLRSKSIKDAVAGQAPLVRAYADLGMRFLLLGGTEQEKLYPAFFEYMQYLSDLAEHAGLELHIKPHGGLTATGAMCAEVVRKVNRKCFRISYDPGNIVGYMGLDPVKELQDCLAYVSSMCVKDVIRTTREDRNVHITAGTGMVNFRGVFDVLEKSKFSGPCLMETVGGSTTQEKIQEARRAMQFLSQFAPWEG